MPIAGAVSAEIEAESPEKAKELFYENWSNDNPDYQLEWDFYEKVIEGNVCYVPYHKMDIDEI